MINIENIILVGLFIIVMCVYLFIYKKRNYSAKDIICSHQCSDDHLNKVTKKKPNNIKPTNTPKKTDRYIIENFFNSDGGDVPMPVSAYPLHPNIDVDIYNYDGNINNYMLHNVNNALEKSKSQLNQDVKDTTFNYQNNPIGMIEIKTIEFEKIAKYIIKVVNDNLLSYETIEILNVINILNITAGKQMKKEFNIICSYKLGYGKSDSDTNDIGKIRYGNNNLIINASIISTLIDGNKELYVEKLKLEELTSDSYLPGNNYLEDYYSYKRPLTTKYIRSDAETIAEEYLLDNAISEELLYSDSKSINTDEISSFFS